MENNGAKQHCDETLEIDVVGRVYRTDLTHHPVPKQIAPRGSYEPKEQHVANHYWLAPYLRIDIKRMEYEKIWDDCYDAVEKNLTGDKVG